MYLIKMSVNYDTVSRTCYPVILYFLTGHTLLVKLTKFLISLTSIAAVSDELRRQKGGGQLFLFPLLFRSKAGSVLGNAQSGYMFTVRPKTGKERHDPRNISSWHTIYWPCAPENSTGRRPTPFEVNRIEEVKMFLLIVLRGVRTCSAIDECRQNPILTVRLLFRCRLCFCVPGPVSE